MSERSREEVKMMTGKQPQPRLAAQPFQHLQTRIFQAS